MATAVSDPKADDVVLTGLSGRLPESESIEQFAEQLFAGADLVTADDRRWPQGLHGLPKRSGKIKELAHFDATFFGVHAKQADLMDPQLRMLLEVTHETIVDAGINPAELRGSRTGVFMGVCTSESEDVWFSGNPDKINGYALLGCYRSMFPNRISYTFDFKGPSYAIDTSCSSSMCALTQAVDAIRAGQCDAAVVAGSNLCLNPATSLNFHRLNMLSPEGRCAAFDESGCGYVRSEAVVVVLLQRRSAARRVYATVRGAGVNNDGNKEQGITYPSGAMQRQLMQEVFQAAGLRPQDVDYVEADGTGTQAGDPQEVNAIADFFCKDRKKPLLLGSVKSNMGHSEPVAGLCSIAKIILAMENGMIPGNLHYQSPNPKIAALSDGRIKVVSRNTPWNGGLVAVNSLGFGGVNAHVILESEQSAPAVAGAAGAAIGAGLPRLVLASGRTEEAVRALLQHAQAHRDSAALHALLDAVHALPIPGHAHRGYRLLTDPPQGEILEMEDGGSMVARPVWFMFPGMGSHLPGIGRSLMALPVFAASISRCALVLKPFGMDLERVLNEVDEKIFESIVNCFVSITAVQVALVDLLWEIGITPEGIVGVSLGEVGCAYADGALTAEQAVLCAYWRGRSVVDAKVPPGAMAVVGLTWEVARQRCPPDVELACHNVKDSVTISGSVPSVKKFVAELTKENIFARHVNSAGVAYHSKYIAKAAPLLRKNLEKVILKPKLRSARWVTSSLPEDQWSSESAKLVSAEYFVNNLLSPVWLSRALEEVPKHAVLLEIAPHALMAAHLRRSLPHVVNIPLVRREASDATRHLLTALGKLFVAGCQPRVGRLYPPVQWPVPRGTPALASHVRWDHLVKWSVADFNAKQHWSENIIEYDLSCTEDAFIGGHNIDGRILFPVAGIITLVWDMMAKLNKKKLKETCVLLENVEIHCATILSHEAPLRLLVNILEGEFKVCNSSGIMASGNVRLEGACTAEYLIFNNNISNSVDSDNLPLDFNDIYKELRLRGYNYEGQFCSIYSSDNHGTVGQLAWKYNWTSFIDAMIQFVIIGLDTSQLYLPTTIQRVVIDPSAHAKALASMNGTLQVEMHKDIKMVKSGGVEMHGIKLTIAPRRQNSQPAPKLEKYVFAPYDNANLRAKDIVSSNDALTVSLQLVLEYTGLLKVKIMEEALDKAPEALLLPLAMQLMEKEPQVCIDPVLYVGVVDNKYASLQELGIKVKNKIIQFGEAAIEDCDVILGTNVLSRHSGVLSALARALAPRGTLLLQEPVHMLDTCAAADAIAATGLIVLMRQMTASSDYILLGRKITMPSTHLVLEVTGENYAWVSQLQTAMKQVVAEDSRLYLWSREQDSGILGLAACLRDEVGGRALRVFHVPGARAAFTPDAPEYAAQVQKDLTVNVLRTGVWGCYRHLPLANLPLQVEHAYVNTMTRGDLSSLRWFESDLRYVKEQPLPAGVDLCTIDYASLNFRDVMLATGKLPPDALPGKLAGQECVLGLEFSGRSSHGARVMGMVEARGLATSVLCDEAFLWRVPAAWSLEEAATVPVAYSTAYYALVVRGRMRRGEAVLVHASAGGVGQAAIAIALHAGCTVFTTVGTPAKRAFLLARFPALRPENVGNSRDTSFEQLVMQQTHGRGVDLVLNSLAHDKLLASVRCLAEGGRFLEIGKLDLSENAPLGMSIFLKNTTFHGILLYALFDAADDDVDKTAVVRCMAEGIANGVVRPLPVTVFSDQQLEEAFRYMAGGAHIGKVVVRVPGGGPARAVARTYLRAGGSYVVVGGLGGVGLELGSWLVARGARRLMLVSRSGVRSGYQARCVRRWRRAGARVLLAAEDAATPQGARRLLRAARDLAPVAGVFNLAAVLRRNYLENQTEDDFIAVAKPKIDITRALDIASRELAPDLEHFVVFSSMACGRGILGQSNYGLANSAMERMMERRRADGLPGLAIQWGPVGEVGLMIETSGGEVTEINGMASQSLASCLAALDSLLGSPHAVVSSIVVADKHRQAPEATNDIVHFVANILGIKDPGQVPQTATLAELGMDSLMSAEAKRMLELNFDLVLRAQEIGALTFARLRELDGGAGADGSRTTPVDGQDIASG